MVLSAWLELASKLADSQYCINDIEAFDERRNNTENRCLTYHKQISKAYNKQVRPWTLSVGDLVLKATGYVQKGLGASKFAPKYEGPYII